MLIRVQKPGSRNFGPITNTVLNKDKSAIHPLFNCPEVLYSVSDEKELFAKNFSGNSKLDELDISLPDLLSKTNLKLHISLTPKLVKGAL